MKRKIMYAVGIVGSILAGENAHSQDTIPQGNINVENVSVYANKNSEYGKTVTEDLMKNNPHQLKIGKLNRDELELRYLDVAIEYKKVLVKYGNVKTDYEVIKSKNSQLESTVKDLDEKYKKTKKELRECVTGEEPKDKSSPKKK